MLRRMIVPVVAFALMGSLTFAASAAIVSRNGDFETGDLSSWELYTMSTGTIGVPAVELFDVDCDSTPGLAVKLKAGQAVMDDGGCGPDPVCRNSNPDLFEGGGLRQQFEIGRGGATVSISANVATMNPWVPNHTGGLFELLVSGAVADAILVGRMEPAETVRGTLFTEMFLLEGTYDVAIQVTRPWGAGTNTPTQYIDDVIVDVAAGMTKWEMLRQRENPGKGIEFAPGLQTPATANASSQKSR